MKVTITLYNPKEDSYAACLQAGLSEDAADNLGKFIGYEVELTYEVTEPNGEGKLIAVNGYKISDEKI